MSAGLLLRGVAVAYGKTRVVSDVDLALEPGELHALLGPSGSGKTSLLRAVAGFEPVAAGSITLSGRVVDDGRRRLPPEARGVGVVFQDYALFPHLDVARNIAFGRRTMLASEIESLLQSVGLAGYGTRHVSDLSGGEQQRVALARALAQQPALILLDEPFSSVNRELRRALRVTTVELLRARSISALFVTHDAEEAFCVADRISVLHRGRLLQTGSPHELYVTPNSLEVACSVGEVIALPAEPDGPDTVRCALGVVRVRNANTGTLLLLRPEQLQLAPDGPGVRARVCGRRWLGPSEELEISLPGGTRVCCRVAAGALPDRIEEVSARIVGAAHCVGG